MPGPRPVSEKLVATGEPTVVYGPPDVVPRCTAYEVAPVTEFQVRLTADADTPVATTPLGAVGRVSPDACADSAEVPDEFTAATT